MSTGLLKPTADTQINNEDPNIVGADVTIVTSKGIGKTVGKTVIDLTARPVSLTADQRLAFAAADRPDVTYVGGTIVTTVLNFAGNTLTRTDGVTWSSDYAVGKRITI